MSIALKSLLIDIVGGVTAMIVAAWAFARLFEVRVSHRRSGVGDAGGAGDVTARQLPHLLDASDEGGYAGGGSGDGGGDGAR